MAVATGTLAQGVTGSAITGTVTAAEKGPLKGVSVQLRNTATGDTFTAASGPSGQFFLDNVPAGGPYTLTATAEGFQPTVQDNIQLTLGQRVNFDVSMHPSYTEEIKVTAHFDQLGDKKRTGATTTMKSAVITELPLQGRNFTDLVQQDPRVTANAGGISIAGQNKVFNNIQIDGGANNDLFGLAASGTPGGQANAKPLSLEAIQEFQVQVAPFDVRQSSFVGGLVNAVTKSGTNDWHASLFGYLQDKALTNQNAYSTQNGVYGNYADPNYGAYNTYQFGGTLSGPIIPDKAHFFASVDIQQKEAAFTSANNLSGDSAADKQRLGFDAADAQRFSTLLSQKYGINAGSSVAPNLGTPDRNIFLKVTSSAIENSHLELSYNNVKATQDVLLRNPTSPSAATLNPATGAISVGNLRDGFQMSNGGYGQANDTNTGRVKLTTNWDEGRFSNEFLAGVSIIRDERSLPENTPLILVKAPGKAGSSDSWLAAGGERFSQANILDQDVYQLQDNLTWAMNQHRLTAGTGNEFFKFRNVFLQAATGAWTFDCINNTDCPIVNGVRVDTSLENGKATSFQRRFGVSPDQEPGTANFKVAQWGFYLQDEWSLMDNLSITPGIRMDVPFLSHANTNQQLLTAALPIDTGKVPSGNLLWSPRIGFNWDVEGNANTVLRGGAGVFTGRPPYVWVSNAYSINGLSQVQLTCAIDPATRVGVVPKFTPDASKQPSDCAGGTGTPTAPTNVGEVDYIDPDTKYPQNFRVAFGMDKRLPFGIIGSADFLYTRDINGWYITDQNLVSQGYDGDGRAIYGTFAGNVTGTTPFRANSTRIDTVNMTNAVEIFNKNGGHVTSGTLQLQRPFGRRYLISVAYTYARSMDRISFTSSQAFSNFQFAPVDGSLDNRAVRPSAFDRPHKVTVTGTAALPYGFLVGLSYIGMSGLPYTWTVNGDVNGDGVNGNDLVFVPASQSQITLQNPGQYAALSSFINSQSCLRDAQGGFVARGACRNQWQDFFDTRLSWTSPEFKWGQRIEVQWDIFNVLNLLNPRWGHIDQVANFENAPTAFLRAVGYDQVNRRPVYSFTAPSTINQTVYGPTVSRWRMQFGARYMF
ncbi:MAG TPA: carboxypeptidase regulatory-like domain-containing protein [Myxococcales bacterium]|nr:carboxypeptidase regulatory-like domain-containing protein [Myxococcales bacterium]